MSHLQPSRRTSVKRRAFGALHPRRVAPLHVMAGVVTMATFGYFRKSPRVEQTTAPATAGATFGPWADHAARCKCNVCR